MKALDAHNWVNSTDKFDWLQDEQFHVLEKALKLLAFVEASQPATGSGVLSVNVPVWIELDGSIRVSSYLGHRSSKPLYEAFEELPES